MQNNRFHNSRRNPHQHKRDQSTNQMRNELNEVFPECSDVFFHVTHYSGKHLQQRTVRFDRLQAHYENKLNKNLDG